MTLYASVNICTEEELELWDETSLPLVAIAWQMYYEGSTCMHMAMAAESIMRKRYGKHLDNDRLLAFTTMPEDKHQLGDWLSVLKNEDLRDTAGLFCRGLRGELDTELARSSSEIFLLREQGIYDLQRHQQLREINVRANLLQEEIQEMHDQIADRVDAAKPEPMPEQTGRTIH